jgi:hypothetical protein
LSPSREVAARSSALFGLRDDDHSGRREVGAIGPPQCGPDQRSRLLQGKTPAELSGERPILEAVGPGQRPRQAGGGDEMRRRQRHDGRPVVLAVSWPRSDLRHVGLSDEPRPAQAFDTGTRTSTVSGPTWNVSARSRPFRSIGSFSGTKPASPPSTTKPVLSGRRSVDARFILLGGEIEADPSRSIPPFLNWTIIPILDK